MQSFFWTPKIEPMLLLLLPFLSSTLSNWKEWSCREWYILVKVCGEHWDFCPKAKNCFSFLVGVPFTLRDTSPTHPQGLGLAYLMHVWGVEYLIAALCVSCYLNIITEAKHTHSSYKYAPSFVVWITRAICAHTVYCARDSPPGKGGEGAGGHNRWKNMLSMPSCQTQGFDYSTQPQIQKTFLGSALGILKFDWNVKVYYLEQLSNSLPFH